jgi:hypothetical protein
MLNAKQYMYAIMSVFSKSVCSQWWVVDQLVSPAVYGDYILQWRWDNEQTPQGEYMHTCMRTLMT